MGDEGQETSASYAGGQKPRSHSMLGGISDGSLVLFGDEGTEVP